MLIRKGFRYLIEEVFFDRFNALGLCIFIATLSYLIEDTFKIANLFSSSGTIFTIAGLFLNIKLTAHFHLKLPNGEPLGLESKNALITGAGGWLGNEEKSIKL